jgi:hypothetical protein
MPEPSRIERTILQKFERLQNEDRFVGIMQAGEAEPDVV